MIRIVLIKKLQLQDASTKYNNLFKLYLQQTARKPYISSSGFTLLETLVVIVMIGILAAIAGPSWLAFVNMRRLNAAQDQVYRTMREAQSNAKRDKVIWEACFHDNGNQVLASTHTVPTNTWNCSQATNWVSIAGEDSKFITINSTSTQRQNPSSYYRVRYKFNGVLDTQDGGAENQLGIITLGIRNGNGNPKRCVVVSTLLGVLRTAQNNDCLY